MVKRMELTHVEILDILDVENTSGSTVGYTLPPGINKIDDISLMLKSLLPKKVKVYIAIDDFRLKSNLTANKSIMFTEKSFLITILDFTQSHSGVLGDGEGFVQMISGSYKIDEPVSNTGIHKNLLKCDCNNGNKVNGVREPFLQYCIG